MFKLSTLLGGRNEVINAPAVELLKYMEMEVEKIENEYLEKQAELYINYLSNIFSRPLEEKPSQDYINAKKEFEKLIAPDIKKDDGPKKIAQYEWDFDPEDYIDNDSAEK